MTSESAGTALVTGAGRGIGRAIARRLASDGMRVAVHYGTSHEAAEAVASEIRAGRGDAFTVGADLSTMEGVARLAEDLRDRGQSLRALVNNAGIQVRDGLENISPDDFDRLFAVNVRSPFFLIRELLPLMSEGGRIVNISSGLSMAAFPEKSVYAMTKAALNSMTRTLAKELGPRGITVNAVLPGIVGTDMNPWARSGPGRERASAISPLGRLGEPEDIAAAVSFLCGPESTFVTGTLLDLSGGAGL